MKFASRHDALSWKACLIVALAMAALPGRADVTVTIDERTLNEVLPELAQQEVTVPVSVDQALTVRMTDMRITGFEPTAGAEQPGSLLTSVTLEVAELGSSISVTPRISLHAITDQEPAVLELRFEQLALPVPLMPPIDIAHLLPPLRFPADNVWQVNGAQGDVRVMSRLKSVRIEPAGIRFDFSVDAMREP